MANVRKIVIEFELPEDIEADYSDTHPQLVFEDLFPSQIGFRVVSDTAQQSVHPTDCPRCNNKGYYLIGSDEIRCLLCHPLPFAADGGDSPARWRFIYS